MHREMSQGSLAETLVSAKLGQNQRLERIDRAVAWDRLDKLVEGVYSAKEGRPSYPPLMMVKVLLLEQWYNLSDPQMEEALNDRMAFRRFVGLGFQKDAPDYSTISRFRTALGEELSAQLFAELERQLEEQGMVLKRGTLMDATLVQAQVRRPPLDKGRGAKSPTDPDADWTGFQRGSRSHFGYKVHIGVDEGSGIVRTATLRTKDEDETQNTPPPLPARRHLLRPRRLLHHTPDVSRQLHASLFTQHPRTVPGLGGLLHRDIRQLQSQAVHHAYAVVEVCRYVSDVQDVPVRPAHVAQRLDIALSHGRWRESQLFGPFQHGPLPLGEVGLSPVVLNILGGEIVAANPTQGPCVGHRSIATVGSQ